MSLRLLLLALLSLATLGCPSQPAGTGGTRPLKLTLGAYTTPREAYGQLIPMFREQWKNKTGQQIEFEESYLGSGAQSRAIVEGFEADITALSLQADIDRITRAGLITHDWQAGLYRGIVSTSIVVLGVRKGNPKQVLDWADLARPGIEILTPNAKTSGGAMWNILAVYGAALRGKVKGVPKGDERAATEFLTAVLKNVTVMDKGARESITNYEKGVGDVVITYENEILVGRKSGQDYELVIPASTILIENPVAVVDKYVEEHGTREAAEGFRDFLLGAQAQAVFAEHGLRPVDPQVARATQDRYPAVQDLFTIAFLGGWEQATPRFFGDAGIYTAAAARAQK
ncbi:MAG: sulfate ABC transporter substrate-binding protein [Armatimonadetes bacterium]|nr:sulfate ABC transporter substrate-binding protein [Armatimonadota bacterium]